MKTNNKPDSLVAACFGMVASFLFIAALSGCGGGAGGGGVDPNNPPPPPPPPPVVNGSDIANATTSADGNTFTISSFAGGLSGFSVIENVPNAAPIDPANTANGSAAPDSVDAHATQGTHSVDLNFISNPAADHQIGLALNGNGGLADWTPFRYVHFDIKTGASAFNGSINVLSKSNYSGWCVASGSVAANSTGTLTMDMDTCTGGYSIDKTLVQRLQLWVDNPTTAGHFYIDNVRLEKAGATPPVSATDAADGTPTTVTTTLLTSFRNGTSAWGVYDNTLAASAALATITTDRPSTYAAEGNTAMKAVVSAGVSADVAIGVVPSKTDWTGAGTLLVDMAAEKGYGWVQLWVKNSAGQQCWDSHAPTAGGNAPAATVTTMSFDLTKLTCEAGVTYNPADVQSYYLLIQGWPGAYYIDNIRLVAASAPPVTADIADGTTSVDGNTFTISSFASGLSSFVAIDDADNNVTATNATATQDTTATNATEGSNSAQLTVTALPTAGADPWIALASRSNGGLAAWSPYRYLRFSVKTGAAAFGGMAVVQSGASYIWCGGTWADIPAGSSADVTVDLTTCTGGDLADVRKFFVFTKSLGTFHIDNVRLTKN